MPPTVKQLPPLDTLPGLLLLLTALSGELPPAQVNRLSDTSAYKSKVIKFLKQKNLLRSIRRDGLRGLRLSANAKSLLRSTYPDWFQPLLTGNTETNNTNMAITRRLRLHRMAEVLVTMYNAGISFFPWEKPAVFQPVPPAGLWLCDAAYYSSREVKEMGPQGNEIRGSRATGVLLTDDDIFAVYNIGPGRMKWEYKAEMRLKAVLKIELCQYRLPTQLMDATLSCIVFGDSMAPMEGIMNGGDPKSHSYFVLDETHEHFYYLTNDHYGEVLLQLLCREELREALDEILRENLSPARPGWVIDNDGMDEQGSPVLFGYTCDMPRIRRFDTALELHKQHGAILCFDFQEETLRQVCGPRVSFQSIDFAAYEGSVLHQS